MKPFLVSNGTPVKFDAHECYSTGASPLLQSQDLLNPSGAIDLTGAVSRPIHCIRKLEDDWDDKKVDYKEKTLKLMDEIIDLKVKQKKYESRIYQLENKCMSMESQKRSPLNKGSQDLQQQVIDCLIIEQKKDLSSLLGPPQNDERESKRKTKLWKSLNTFEKQIWNQYDKVLKNKLIKHEDKMSKKNQRENQQLKNEIKELKREYAQLLCENHRLKDNIEQLREDLRESIEKYEQIEIAVTDKMNVYRETIKEYQIAISSYRIPPHQPEHSPMPIPPNATATQFTHVKAGFSDPFQKQGGINNHDQGLHIQFSFAKDSTENKPNIASNNQNNNDAKSKDTCKLLPHFGNEFEKNKEGDIELPMGSIGEGGKETSQAVGISIECYQASIDGLLQQNKRLKRSFQTLYKLRQGETLPSDLLKEIAIMRSILELNEIRELGQT